MFIKQHWNDYSYGLDLERETVRQRKEDLLDHYKES